MSKQIEALKLALEALQHEADIGNDDAYKLERDAIKEALAGAEGERQQSNEQVEPFGIWHQGATEDESDFYLYKDSGDVSCPDCIKLFAHPPVPMEQPKEPEQEPVAYIEHHKGGDNLEWDDPGGKRTPLYTTPPQRTWVGLTLDERIELAKDVDWAIGAYCEYAEKIEAKLKEKNA